MWVCHCFYGVGGCVGTGSAAQVPLDGVRCHPRLTAERHDASFPAIHMTHVLDGGADGTANRRHLWRVVEADADNSHNMHLTRSEQVQQHVTRMFELHKRLTENPVVPDMKAVVSASLAQNSGGLGLHFFAFTVLWLLCRPHVLPALLPLSSHCPSRCVGVCDAVVVAAAGHLSPPSCPKALGSKWRRGCRGR